MGFPKLLIAGGSRKIEELQMSVQKELNCVNRKLNIAITRLGNPYGHPNILAEFIAGQLKNRVSFRKAMKKTIELTEQAGTKGIQIEIVGRIDGKEIARVKWIREGRVPLQTIRAKLDYCCYPIRLWRIRHKNLDICRRAIISPYSTCVYVLFNDRPRNDTSVFFI